MDSSINSPSEGISLDQAFELASAQMAFLEVNGVGKGDTTLLQVAVAETLDVDRSAVLRNIAKQLEALYPDRKFTVHFGQHSS